MQKDMCNSDLQRSRMPEDATLTMAYVPFQDFEEPYETLIGFDKGTIFPALDKPFYGSEVQPK